MASIAFPKNFDALGALRTRIEYPLLFATLRLDEPHYQTVRYRAALDRVDFQRKDTFYGLGPTSPSDCVWMVPVQP